MEAAVAVLSKNREGAQCASNWDSPPPAQGGDLLEPRERGLKGGRGGGGGGGGGGLDDSESRVKILPRGHLTMYLP